jgi:uncharacterized MnhB-related membrane protein
MKRVFAILVAAILSVALFSTTVSASAAAKESDIITALVAANVPDEYCTLAESYLNRPDVELTEAQIVAIIAYINDAKKTAGDIKDPQKWIEDQKLQILSDVLGVCRESDLKFVRNNDNQYSIYDNSGKTLLRVDNHAQIKKTGNDYSLIPAGMALIALAGVTAVAGKMIVRRRKTTEA